MNCLHLGLCNERSESTRLSISLSQMQFDGCSVYTAAGRPRDNMFVWLLIAPLCLCSKLRKDKSTVPHKAVLWNLGGRLVRPLDNGEIYICVNVYIHIQCSLLLVPVSVFTLLDTIRYGTFNQVHLKRPNIEMQLGVNLY